LIRIIKYVFYDILRSRFILLYMVLLVLTSIGMFQLDSDTSKVILSLMNIQLMVVPLVSVIFTTIHFYNSYEFIEMMLAQPVNRRIIFFAEYLAVSLSLSLAFLIGVGVPMLFYGTDGSGLTLVYSGVILSLVFVSLAFLSAVLTRDKARAIGIALLVWLYFTLIYDALILWIVYAFSDYPLENTTLVLISLNPVDLARILMVLKLDISALMGYTGAFYREFFGSGLGLFFSISILICWIVIPTWFTLRVFRKKDL
jgi:Cu-processing system permease protein